MLNEFLLNDTYLRRGESIDALVLVEEAESPARDAKSLENSDPGDIVTVRRF
jgi:hypothetical protein